MISQPTVCNADITTTNPRFWYADHDLWVAYKTAESVTVTASLISAFPAQTTPKFLHEIAVGKNKHINANISGQVAGGVMRYKHSVEATFYQKNAKFLEDLRILTQCQKVVVIVELDGINAEGKFLVLGDLHGLELADGAELLYNLSEAETGGAPVVTLRSNADNGRTESHAAISLWVTDAATTVAAITANLVV